MAKLFQLAKEVLYTITETGCYECTSHSIRNGYPSFWRDGKGPFKIVRYLYEQNHGKIPDKMVLRHKCDNKKCINLDHIELGTHLDNMKDRYVRGRCRPGSRTLSDEQVIEIYLSPTEVMHKELASKYGVHLSLIGRIRQGKAHTRITQNLGAPLCKEVHRIRKGSKLTSEEARTIFQSNDSVKILAEKYGVSPHTIDCIRCGYSWSEVNKELISVKYGYKK